MQMHNKIVKILIRLYLFLKFHFCFVVEAARWLNCNLFGFSRVEAFFFAHFCIEYKKADFWFMKQQTQHNVALCILCFYFL